MTFITNYCILRKGKIITPQGVDKIDSESIELFQSRLYEKLQLSYPKFYKMDDQCRLGLLASELLLKNNKINYPPEAVAVVLTNASASYDADVSFEASSQTIASPALFVYTLSSIVIGEICIRHGITGENAFYVTPEFDANLHHDYVDMILSQPHTKACISGWVEVAEGQFDVFLYLAEKESRGAGLNHTTNELQKIYLL